MPRLCSHFITCIGVVVVHKYCSATDPAPHPAATEVGDHPAWSFECAVLKNLPIGLGSDQLRSKRDEGNEAQSDWVSHYVVLRLPVDG